MQSRNAELALYRRCPDEAETILLQARPPLLYRAIDLNIRLFRWGRALELAVKHKKHVDTVLGYRQKFLQQANKTETEKRFLQYAEVPLPCPEPSTGPLFPHPDTLVLAPCCLSLGTPCHAQVEIDWEAIRAKIDIEIEDERARRTGAVTGSGK